uniref:hypothetical protein n=1 Tax=Cupriavidus necator TaxID=106590 RepID=UPI003F49A2CD
MTSSCLRLLAANGIITPELRNAALQQSLDKAAPPEKTAQEPFVTRKAANHVRADIGWLTGADSR